MEAFAGFAGIEEQSQEAGSSGGIPFSRPSYLRPNASNRRVAVGSCCIYVNYLVDRLIVVVYTQRDDARHIISMRKANAREKARFTPSDRF
jgi:uncharacterized DUF497 family protein